MAVVDCVSSEFEEAPTCYSEQLFCSWLNYLSQLCFFRSRILLGIVVVIVIAEREEFDYL